MEPERWTRVEQLYHAALEVTESQREAFIEETCAGNEALMREVRTLLAQPQAPDSFLEAPALEVVARALAMSAVAGAGAETGHADPAGGAPAIPAAIGRYRVVRLLGEGGMGAVYEAEQEQPRRIVALKVIKPGYATAETLRRFQHESQALGRLHHPGIAQIYEASTADTGFGPQPYFAMELIRGQPLPEYAGAHQLNSRDRLAIMARVCDAADHAHRRGVIHRDLKPANILVDETGQPKILDFGVARVTGSDAQLTRQTTLGQLVGTLAYMSPEQVLGDPLAVDTRSDVYALGVILYELLAGKLPYNVDRKTLPEAVEIIREEEPAHLSSIDRGYRGDIETIAAKALEKDRARRYSSAADLAEDIRRYLADQPITARPPSASYQLQKFVRRHKAFVAGATAVFLVLAAGVVASSVEVVRARAEKRRADVETATAQAVNDFLQNDLLAQASAANQSGPSTRPDPNLTVRTALDRAAARIAGKFDRQPAVEGAIRSTIGHTYGSLGLFPQAQKQLERALDLERRVLGTNDPETLRTMSRLAQVFFFQGKYVQAEALDSQVVDTERRVLGPEHPDTLLSMYDLAIARFEDGKFAPAEALLRQTVDIQRRVLGPEHRDTLMSMGGLGNMFFSQGKFAQAEAIDSQTVQVERRVLGPEHPTTLVAMDNLASAYGAQGKYAQAEALHRQTLEIERRVLGPEHPSTLSAMDNLAQNDRKLGNYAQAEVLASQALDISRRLGGAQSRRALYYTSELAAVYSAEGKYAQAQALLRQALETLRKVLGPDHPITLNALSVAASMYQRQGKYALAETYAAQALAGLRHVAGSDDPDTISETADLALAYQSQKKFSESEPLAREAVAGDRKMQPDNWQRFRAESLLGASLAGQKKYAEAEPLLLEGYQGMLARKERIAAPDRYQLDLARGWIFQLYQAWGKPDKAAEWSHP